MDGKLRNMTTVYLLREHLTEEHRKQQEILLLYRIGSRVVLIPSWCGIGGHFEKEELNDAKACALREMEEEIGITEADLGDISLRYVTLRHKKNEIRQIYYFFAKLKDNIEITKECNEGVLKWVPVDEAMDLEMPYTAKYVVEHYLSEGKDTDAVYGGIAEPEQVHFVEMKAWE